MRFRAVVAVSLFFAVLSFGLVEFNTHFVAKRMADAAYSANIRSVALIERALSNTVSDAFFSAGLLLANASHPELINQSNLLLSVMALDWKGEDFAYSARIDNSDFLRAHQLTGGAITKAVADLHNDIANGGANQDLAFATQIESEIPILVFVHSTPAQSILIALQASGLLRELRDGSNTLTFVVDRFGTVLLHPEQERATLRESSLQNPILKRLFLSATDREAFQLADGFGFFARMPFAGMAVISQISSSTVLEPVGTLRFTLAMAALVSICATFAALHIMTMETRKKRQGSTGESSELKTAA